MEMGENVRTQIEESLTKQLKDKGATQSHYSSLIQDYLAMWDIKNELRQDITERGVSVSYNNGGGQTGYKKNDSITELVKVNNQMLKILSDLGLRGAAYKMVVEVDEL